MLESSYCDRCKKSTVSSVTKKRLNWAPLFENGCFLVTERCCTCELLKKITKRELKIEIPKLKKNKSF
jgi:hypothetical protein